VSDLSEPGTAPLTPPGKSSLAYRGLLAAVILLGILIIIALGILVGGLVTRFRSGGHEGSVSSAPAQFTLAPGARIVSSDVSGDRLVLHVRGPAGDELDIIDIGNGRLIAKIVSAQPPRK
jgi:hypothetical protein